MKSSSISKRFVALFLCVVSSAGFACAQNEAAQTESASKAPKKQNAESGEKKKAVDHTTHKRATNRLADETSPYLLLHAHNPVDWYPWGPEAFEKAKKENKPIFLSIGYSSCYWCHVMERGAFTNSEIAAYMNEHFVNIKVDREERPDVDDIYMTSLIVYHQAIGSAQGGGWPLSMFLTPDKKPFAGGTYFPAKDEQGRMGFDSVSKRINEIWTNDEKRIRGTAELLTTEVKRIMRPQFDPEPTALDKTHIERIAKAIKDSFDEEHGGVDFSKNNPNAPKFPTTSKLQILGYAADRLKDADAQRMLDFTLDRIARGGIRDHLAGGFHRYSTDRRWHVPHFEKMLYDQSQLAYLYTTAWQRSQNPQFKSAATTILDYVLRDFTHAGGGFYSALDAETDTIEGKYYVWSEQEIQSVLGDDADLFMQAYGMKSPNDFEHGFVLHMPKSLVALAKQQGLSPEELDAKLQPLRKKVLALRDKRKSPLRDDKVLTSWNGLMVGAYARAAAAFSRDDYRTAAEKAAEFLLSDLRSKNGRLNRTWREGKSKLTAYLDDYAFVVHGLLELHDVTKQDRWLTAAKELTDIQVKHFWSESGKGFFFTADDHEELIARTRNAYDNVLPSGNSVSVRNLVRLAALTKDDTYQTLAKETLEVFMPVSKRAPTSMTNMAIALGEYLDGPWTLPSAAVWPAESDAAIFAATNSTPEVFHEAKYVPVVFNQSDGKTQSKPNSSTTKPKKKKPQRVKARAYLSVDKLPAGKQVRMVVIVEIQKGWHINADANSGNPEFLEASKLSIKSKFGTKLAKVKYPKAKKIKVEGFDEEFQVYEGKVVIHGLLQVPPKTKLTNEEFQISLDYQACDDNRCLKPSKVTLAGKVPIAPNGERVKLINAALFPDLHRRRN